MKAYDAYRIYSQIQLHFKSDKYNYKQYANTPKTFSEQAFMRRRDKYQFEKLGKQFNNKEDFEFYCACQMFENQGKLWVGDATDVQSSELYYAQKGYLQQMDYQFNRSLSEFQQDSGGLYGVLGTSETRLPKIIYDICQNRSSTKIVAFTLINRATNIRKVYDAKYLKGEHSFLYKTMTRDIWKFGDFVTLNSVAEQNELRQAIKTANKTI